VSTMTTGAGMMQFLSPQLLDEKLKAEKAYWLDRLSGWHASTPVPLDAARPAAYSAARDRVVTTLDEPLRARLLQVSGGNELLAFAILIAAVKIVLHKYSGAEDIIVGTTVHNRYREVAAVNRTLVLRNAVSGAMPVKQLFGAVKQSLADAYAHQKYPFVRLVELLDIEQPSNRQTGFQVAVGLAGVNEAEHLDELKTDINILFSVAANAITADIHYGARLFHRQTIDQFRWHIVHVLRTTLQAPNAAIDEIDLLTAERRRFLVDEVNRTSREYPQAAVHHLFERQVDATPLAVAIECGPEEVTFADLNGRANQVARHLRQSGIGPGQLVGLCFDHSVSMIVALLGVLKAGAGYVPLDPAHPAARLSFLLSDAAIRVALTTSALREHLSSSAADIVCLDTDWGTIAAHDTSNVGRIAEGSDLAYVIYTSGSTGQPKGVAIEHRSVVNYITWANDTYGQGDRLDVALYSSFAFDLTVTSIFGPLLSGDRMVIYPDRGLDHPLFDAMRENRSGLLKMTPSHLQMIVERGARANRVRRVVVGGEALPADLASRARACFADDVVIFNEYGPTEATVGCTMHRFDPEQRVRTMVPIGRPGANARVYILDERNRPVAENVIGELAIAGDGLARGYVNRPDLTGQRFVDSPIAAGERVYRSGDLARWLPDGVIEYVGRKDEQVKVHGYRVELNELRLAVNEHAGVKDCVVVVCTDAAGVETLAAYYDADQPIEAADLRAFLIARVIEETIPNYFIHVDGLPLTANGKVDLRALPTIDEARAAAAHAFVMPRTQTEELLSGVWALVLGLPLVGITAEFFELGGHSLLAHQIISRARALFQVDVPLRALFEAPTVEQLSAVIDRLARERAGAFTQVIPPASRERDLPVSFGQQRLWIMHQLRAESVSYNIYPSFEVTGPLNAAALAQSLNEMVRRHESLRTTFHMKDGQLVQAIAPALTLAIPETDLSGVSGDARARELDALVDRQVRQPFDLAAGPLLRAHLARLEPEHHVLFLAMHHIISDAASMGIFYRELAECYGAFCARAVPTLAPLTIQYADYASWQRAWMTGDVLDRQVEYWREQLRDAPPVLDLHPGRARPEVLGHDGTYTGLMLSRALSDAIKDLARRERCTVFMVLLAAFQTVLRHYARVDDILVGADVANRNRPELEGVIGFLVNTLVLRTRFSGDPTFRELLHRVRESALDAFSHDDVPFEKIVEALNPDRAAGQNPLFQIMFGFVPNHATMSLDLPGLALRPRPLDNQTALFDFSLYMADTPDGLGGTAQYNTALYDGQTIAQVLRLFEIVLAGVAARPDVTVAEIDRELGEVRTREQQAQARELKARRLVTLRTLRPPAAAPAGASRP
jgi:amino acid adenylation domain-containing protein